MPNMFNRMLSNFDNREKQTKKPAEDIDDVSFQLREMRYLNVTSKEQLDKGIQMIRDTINDLQGEQGQLKGVLQDGLKDMQVDVQAMLQDKIEEIDHKIDEAVGFLKTLESLEESLREEQTARLEDFKIEIMATLVEDTEKREEFIKRFEESQKELFEKDKEEQMAILLDLEKTVNEEQAKKIAELEEKLSESEYERKKEFKIVRNYFKAGIWILLINLMFIVVWILGIFN